MSFTIRRAKENDAAAIFSLVAQLAEYEKLELTTTKEIFSTELFGDTGHIRCLVAEVDHTVVGYAIYMFNFSTFLGKRGLYLEDLYITPKQRSRGIGTELLKRIAQDAEKNQCTRVEWCALTWNQKAIDLYERLGARKLDEFIYFRLENRALLDLAKKPPTLESSTQ